MALIPETIVVHRQGAATGEKDGQGNPVFAADTSFDLLIKAFAPQTSEENAEDFGSVVLSGGSVYGYRGTVVYPSDRFTIRGVDGYQMEGELGDFKPIYSSQSPSGVIFTVRRMA